MTAALASGALLAGGVMAGNAVAAGPSYSFHKLDNTGDLTFNQLLGINIHGVIAGYFGSGAQGHPNKGYVLHPPYTQASFIPENFPGSVQTQVTGLNDRDVTVGFYSHQNNANLVNENVGFYRINGSFHAVKFPTTNNSTPPVNQLLGVNDRDIAVGFYTDSAGSSHGYTFDISTGQFHAIVLPGKPASNTAAAINNHGDIAGFETVDAVMQAFLLQANGHFTALKFPGATATQAFGVNDRDEVVGAYTVGTTSHGFTWTPEQGFNTVDDPDGIGTTTLNGVNDHGQLVGFYTDKFTNVDGLLATPVAP
jgi:hypothetical protein